MSPNIAAPALISGGIEDKLDPDQYAISTHNLASHFDWLRSNGYNVISLQMLIDARNKHTPLPSKAVLLTFDDGLQSEYTRVYPLLKVFHYPAVFAVVGAWIDLPAGKSIDFGPRLYTAKDFVTWPQLKEMQDSGLVEIASHTYDLHRGIQANPQENMIPAAVAHAYDPGQKRYENDAQYAARVRDDLRKSVDEIRSRLGQAPRAIMWPYGEFNALSDSIAKSEGIELSFSLTDSGAMQGGATSQDVPRLLMLSNPNVDELAWNLQHSHADRNVRAVQVDLDYVYDPDPIQQERNLSVLLDRMKQLGATQVWLQAYADPRGDGQVAEVYFPNSVLPMRADLFSRVAWQLRTRCNVRVFAWLPVLSWQLPDAEQQRRLQIEPLSGHPLDQPHRLNPMLPETRTIVGNIYEDLARSVPIAGILFSDDAVLRDTDDLGADAPQPGPDRTKLLIAFTADLKARVQRWNPQLLTARNLFAEPVLHHPSETWYAQSLPAFIQAYDEVGLMAMPNLEESNQPNPWLRRLVRSVKRVPGGLDKTVFELQTVDWRTHKQISSATLARQMHMLQSAGAINLAYYPDDFVANNPDISTLAPVFSTIDSPMRKP